jgi:glutamine transport system substrate-binding protein
MATTARKLTKTPGILLLVLLGTAATVFFQSGVFQNHDDDPAFPYGEIRIAVDASYSPFAIYEEGVPQGLDIDIGAALGEHLNLPVRFVNMNIDGLYDSLINDQADIIISALVVDTWKFHEVKYTRAYFDAGLVLISLVESPVSWMSDLPGHSLAYEFGSIADSEANRWLRRIEAFEAQPYELPQHALDAVRLGVADAALVDAVDARLYLRENPQWQAEMNYVTHVEYVIAVRLDRNNTFIETEKALSNLIQQGVIGKIIQQWL